MWGLGLRRGGSGREVTEILSPRPSALQVLDLKRVQDTLEERYK
jgi:hypothetical protein